VSELRSTVHDAVAALAQSDRACLRFGASQHRYALAAPLDEAALVAIEAVVGVLPEDYRAFVREVAASGAGPGYGLLPIAITTSRLPIAHLGCGYAAMLELAGPTRGQITIDARAIGIVAPIAPSFTAFYAGWIDTLARGQMPEGFVPPGACALAHAIGGYLGMCERRLGLPEGGLTDEPLRDALAELGPGAIAIAADASPLFASGERVDPCITCARTLENLGLRGDVVAPGRLPLTVRNSDMSHSC
jgi:hypothetical protein